MTWAQVLTLPMKTAVRALKNGRHFRINGQVLGKRCPSRAITDGMRSLSLTPENCHLFEEANDSRFGKAEWIAAKQRGKKQESPLDGATE